VVEHTDMITDAPRLGGGWPAGPGSSEGGRADC
jgi:hypothetical protein